MSYQSKYTGQEIDNKLDKVGEIGVLDSVFCKTETVTPVIGNTIPLSYVSGNMTVNGDRIVIKPRQRVQISTSISFHDKTNTYANVHLYLRDFTNDKDIQIIAPHQGDYYYEQPFTYVTQYTNDTDVECEIGLIVTQIYATATIYGEMSTITVHEIGRAMVVPSTRKEVELFRGDGAPSTTITLLDNASKYDEVKFEALFKTKGTDTMMDFVTVTIPKWLMEERLLTGTGVEFNFTCFRDTTTNASLRVFHFYDTTVEIGTILGNKSSTTEAWIKRIVGIKY